MAARYLIAVCACLESRKPHKTDTMMTDGEMIISYPAHKSGGMAIAKWATEEEIASLKKIKSPNIRVLWVEPKDARLLKTINQQCEGIAEFFVGKDVQIIRQELGDLPKGRLMTAEINAQKQVKAKLVKGK